MNCSKCGGATQPRSGVSQKNGRPWSGNKCTQCGNMDFNSTQPGNYVNTSTNSASPQKSSKDESIARAVALKEASIAVRTSLESRQERETVGESTVAQLTMNVADMFFSWLQGGQKPSNSGFNNDNDMF